LSKQAEKDDVPRFKIPTILANNSNCCNKPVEALKLIKKTE